ncbi:histidinol-phosphate transaminase [Fusobacterium sp. 27098_8_59]|jgi:threonine-phosphate decarboxylase|uniref:pyridoxal phosphate-dependent aminotransferase n=1 Tax=Fusobacterium sp. 27098_8_59 TaxID=3003691 RepID=UPI00291575BC|nr:histidinol-phosphate transaminase [Fusobacterium periodonticum]
MTKDLHGGNIYKFQREGKIDILDYSSNINPLGVPQKFIDIAKESFNKLVNYPDPYYINLRKKIAEFNSLDLSNIIVGNGATEILFLYLKALKPKKVLILAPCFAEYERALKSVSAEINYFELKESNNFYPNIENLKKEIETNNYDLLLFCNPNNPTGQFIKLEDIKKIINICENRNTKIFVDEAFIEFIENWQEKTVSLFKNKNIFIMRAFTKFFAIPGLRLGYGIGFDEEILNRMWDEKEPWTVNTFANLAGLVMLDDKEYIEKSEKWILEEKKFMYKELSEFQYLKAYKTECNFILLKIQNISSTSLRDKMIEKNILIRDASNFKFLDYHFVRLAIKDRESNIKVLEALADIMEYRG